MLVSIVSAFLLVPSLYVTSPTTTYFAIPILSLPASMELMVVSTFIFLIIRYHESANNQVYDKEKSSMILIPLLLYMERYCIQLCIDG